MRHEEAVVNGAELGRYGVSGVVTPDHTIRTKNRPLILPAPDSNRLEHFRGETQQCVTAFMQM